MVRPLAKTHRHPHLLPTFPLPPHPAPFPFPPHQMSSEGGGGGSAGPAASSPPRFAGPPAQYAAYQGGAVATGGPSAMMGDMAGLPFYQPEGYVPPPQPVFASQIALSGPPMPGAYPGPDGMYIAMPPGMPPGVAVSEYGYAHVTQAGLNSGPDILPTGESPDSANATPLAHPADGAGAAVAKVAPNSTAASINGSDQAKPMLALDKSTDSLVDELDEALRGSGRGSASSGRHGPIGTISARTSPKEASPSRRTRENSSSSDVSSPAGGELLGIIGSRQSALHFLTRPLFVV